MPLKLSFLEGLGQAENGMGDAFVPETTLVAATAVAPRRKPEAGLLVVHAQA